MPDIIIPITLPRPWTVCPLDDEGTSLRNFYRDQEEGPLWLRNDQMRQVNPWLASPFLDDEIGPLLKYFFRDQEDNPPWLGGAVQVQPWNDVRFREDEIKASAAVVVEQEDSPPWLTVSVQVQPWNDVRFRDDEIGPRLAYFYREQEEPWVAQVQTQPWLPRPFLDDDVIFSATLGVDQEDAWPQLVQAVPWLARPQLDDEIDSQLVYFYREQEEPWVAQVQAQPWTPRVALDDEITSSPTLGIDQEDAWPQRAQAQPWAAVPFRDDEIGSQLAYFFSEQEDAWPQLTQAVPWVSRPALDDDVFASGAFGADQEEPWLTQVQTQPWLARPFLDDEIGPALRYFFLEQQEPWVAQVQTQPWVARPSLDDDVLVAPSAVEDVQPWVGQTQANPWVSRPALDDEVGPRLTNFAREQEEPWVTQVQAVPWASRPFTDDDVWTVFVPPPPPPPSGPFRRGTIIGYYPPNTAVAGAYPPGGTFAGAYPSGVTISAAYPSGETFAGLFPSGGTITGDGGSTAPFVPPVTTLLKDNFAGAAGASIDSRPMDVGPGWVLQTVGVHGGFDLDGSGRAVETGVAGTSANACADAGASDVVVSATLRVPSGLPSGAIGLLARMSALAGGQFADGWRARLDVAGQLLSISERVAGVFTTRASVAAALAFDTDYAVSFRCSGTTLTMTVAGVGSVSYTSAANLTNTYCGLGANTAIPQYFSSFLVTSP